MEKTRKELLKVIKEKAPDLYNELLTESERERIENSQCGENKEYKGHHGGHGNCGGHGNGKQWGGHRCGAGRPRVFCERKTITKQVSEETINKIKDYAKSNNISENEALDRLINAGYEYLENL